MAEAPQVLQVFEMAVKEVSQALAVEQQIIMLPVLKLIPLQRLQAKQAAPTCRASLRFQGDLFLLNEVDSAILFCV